MKSKKWGVLAVCATAVLVVFTAATGFRMTRGMEILVNMYRDLNLFYVDEPDPDKLLEDAARGMTMSLDPYTEYISEEEMTSFEALTRGRYAGIGSLIRQSGDWVEFAEPYEGSPADRAGIEIGDRIVEIEGKSAKGMSPSDVSALLKGDAGTTVRLKVLKAYSGKVESLKIKRELIALPSIPYYGMVADTIGYILHDDFSQDSSNDMRNAVMDLKQQGAKALILDYRTNGGGIMQEAVSVLSLFLPKGTEVVSMRGRGEGATAVYTTQNEPIDVNIPIVALVGGSSASAAEIVAGALQDLDRGVVVGRRSFGKGLVQSTKYLGYNSYLKVTTSKYYLPSGRCVQAIDYAKRDEHGNLTHIPDSLITEFATVNGRKVYDGGGVMPDIVTEPKQVSRFAYILYVRNYISDFATEFIKAHPERVIDPQTFALTDDDYAEFVAFMADKDVEWESETKQTIRLLRQKATKERYIDEIEAQIEALEAVVLDDKESSLNLYRKELTDYIESDIILRKNYSRGVAIHNLTKDQEVTQAIELLGDRERYDTILESQDTVRKY